jgi:hypothetical protein
VFAVAVLLAELGSLAVELTEAVSVITVPLAVPAFTFTIREKVAEVPPTKLTMEHTTLLDPAVQVQPEGAAIETNVVLAGIVATRVALSPALGPLSVTICVYVMLLPAATGFGDAALVTLRSALEITLATSVALSFARLISPPPDTRAVLVTVEGAVCNTFTVRGIEELLFAAMPGATQLTV